MATYHSRAKPKMVNLALQGGGAHGAFTWGVLDKILEDGRIGIDGICACSAGTMNAVALAYGSYEGGNDRAREVLHDLWRNVADTARAYNPMGSNPLLRMLSLPTEHPFSFFMLDSMTRLVSPYQFNPLDINPLKSLLEDTIDFEKLRHCDCVKLFISATHVKTGKVRVFNTAELSIDVALASACLPQLFKAVEIEGEHYWDGGYMGNPSLYPLFYQTDTRDIMILHINPMVREEIPKTAPDIFNRINEISFNSSLIKDMRAIAFVKKLLANDMLKEEHAGKFKDILLHSIRSDEAMCDLSAASKFNTDWSFLTGLRDRGRETMEAWLAKHFDDIGERDTVDLHTEFLSSVTALFDHHNNGDNEPQ